MKRLLLLILLVCSRAIAASQDYYFDSAPFTTYGEFNPSPLYSTTNDGHTVKMLWPSQAIRFASNSASVSIYSYTSTAAGRTYVLLQGPAGGIPTTQVGSVAIPATGSGSYSLYSIATGLSTSQNYEYAILCITPIQLDTDHAAWYDEYLQLDSGSLAAVAHANRPVVGCYGDSITALTSAHMTDLASALITDARYSDTWISTWATGRSMVISGIAGGKVNPTGRDSTVNIPTNVDLVRVEYGTNDLVDLPAGNAAFVTAYSDMIDNIRTRIGAGKLIICLRPFPRATPDYPLASIGTLIQTAISGKANVVYYDTAGWIGTTSDVEPDGLHPNAAGYAQLGPNQFMLYASAPIAQPGGSTLLLSWYWYVKKIYARREETNPLAA